MLIDTTTFNQILARLRANDSTLTKFDLGTYFSGDLSGAPGTGTILHYQLSLDQVRELSEALATNTALAELNLEHANIGREGAVILADALRLNRSLKKVDLCFNNIESGGAAAIADALRSNPTITNLNLSNNNINREAVPTLALMLSENRALKNLNLSYNNLGAAVRAIGPALAVNSHLEALDITHNLIGDQVAEIFESLVSNRTLRYFRAGYNYIGREAGSRIFSALMINSSLEEIGYELKLNDDQQYKANQILNRNRIFRIAEKILNLGRYATSGIETVTLASEKEALSAERRPENILLLTHFLLTRQEAMGGSGGAAGGAGAGAGAMATATTAAAAAHTTHSYLPGTAVIYDLISKHRKKILEVGAKAETILIEEKELSEMDLTIAEGASQEERKILQQRIEEHRKRSLENNSAIFRLAVDPRVIARTLADLQIRFGKDLSGVEELELKAKGISKSISEDLAGKESGVKIAHAKKDESASTLASGSSSVSPAATAVAAPSTSLTATSHLLAAGAADPAKGVHKG